MANNNAKLREALEKCANMGEQIDFQLGSSDETVYTFRDERCLAHNISECARAALAAPPRNCDVGTAEEQGKRFTEFCYKNRNMERCCGDCPAFNRGGFAECELAWAQMPYKEGGAE